MNNCAGVIAGLSAFLDHELEASEADLVREHLFFCPDCGDEFELLRDLDLFLRKWDRKDSNRIKASAAYNRSLRKRLEDVCGASGFITATLLIIPPIMTSLWPKIFLLEI